MERKEKIKCKDVCVDSQIALVLPSPFAFSALAYTSALSSLIFSHFLPFLWLKLPLIIFPTFSAFQAFVCKQWLPFCFSLKLFCKGKTVLAL